LFDNYGESNRKNVQKLEAWMKDRSSARPLVQFPLQALRYVPSKASGADGAQSKLEGLNVVEGEFIGNLHLIPQELDGKIENMLELPPQEQAWIVAYDILPNLQGRGIGKAMLRAGIEGWIRWLGIGTVLAVSCPSASGGRIPCKLTLDVLACANRQCALEWSVEKCRL
jgi:GNAT superfamily N-acetyltransferase